MKKILLAAVVGFFALGCGEKKEEKKEGFEMSRTKSTTTAESSSEGVPVDMSNKGIGPITDLTFPEEINTEMAARGEAKYQAICTAIAKALLKEYNNAIMLNQNLTQEEARDVAEYLRTL